MTAQYTFVMKDLRKIVPPKREILKGIWLSFYPGREDRRPRQQRRRQEHAAPDHGRRRQGLRRRGVAGARAQDRLPRAGAAARSGQDGQGATSRTASPRPARCSQRFEEIIDEARRGRCPTTRWTSCSSEQARLQDQIDAINAWDLDHTVEHRDGRAALPAGRRRRHEDLRRRAAPRRAVPPAARASPTCCCSTSRPTTSTPRASRGSRSTLENFPGTVVAVTHDRYFLDNVAKWILELDRGEGHPFEGNYTGWLEQKAKRLERRGASRTRAPAHARARARVGAAVAEGAPGQEQGAPQPLRRDGRRGAEGGARSRRSRS